MLIFLHRLRSYSPKGFTLTELMVVISIMTILTSVFLIQQRQFDSTTLLRSYAYSVALSIREAQVYGTSVRAFQGNFTARSYGIYFNRTTPSTYILFADLDDDGQYDTPGELVDTYTLTGSFTINEVCGMAATPDCWTGVTDWLAITFRRPNPDACIATSPNEADVCGSSPTYPYTHAYIQIVSPSGTTRSVEVYPTGQISVRGAES